MLWKLEVNMTSRAKRERVVSPGKLGRIVYDYEYYGESREEVVKHLHYHFVENIDSSKVVFIDDCRFYTQNYRGKVSRVG